MKKTLPINEPDQSPDIDREPSCWKPPDLQLQTIWPWYKLGPDLIGGPTAAAQEEVGEDNSTANTAEEGEAVVANSRSRKQTTNS